MWGEMRSQYPAVISVVGASFRTLGVEGREALARLSKSSDDLLSRIAFRCGIREVVLLATCNRFEIVTAAEAGRTGGEDGLLQELRAILPAEIAAEALYHHRNRAAVEHLFRVASGLDSMALGEPQILGQVKDAYRASVERKLAGKTLHHLFQCAFRLAKRIREGTGIAERGISISYVAVTLARQIFGDLRERAALIVGSGRMAELAALHLRSHGCRSMIVANRTVERAAELALRIGGIAAPLEEITSLLPRVDMVIGSVETPKPVIDRATFESAPRLTPLFLIDMGMPRNFSPQVAEVENVYLYNIDDLAGIVDENRALREEAAREAELMIEYGVFQFERWLERLAVEPTVVALRSRVHEICKGELTRYLNGFPEERVDQAAYAISQKISHELTTVVKTLPSGSRSAAEDEELGRLLPMLFDDLLKAL